MLNKLKVTAIVGLAIQALRMFFPALDFGSEFEGAVSALIEAVYVLIPIIFGWFTPESSAEIAKLSMR